MGFKAADPAAYGRLIVGQDGTLEAIIEAKECTPAQLEIDFCNSGVMAGDCQTLFYATSKVDNKNAKGEFYLTDVVGILNVGGKRIEAVEADEGEVLGVNDRIDLANAEAQMLSLGPKCT